MSELAKKRAVDKACNDAKAVFASECDRMQAYYEQEAAKADGHQAARAKELTVRAKAFKGARQGYEREAQRAQAFFGNLHKELEQKLKDME